MANPITLRIITPDAVALDATVDSVVLPGLDGKLGVLSGHATMVTALDAGELRFKSGSGEEAMFVAGGFAEVRDNTLRVVTEASERASDIDVARAEAALKRAKDRLATKATEVDSLRAEAAMRRATMRLTLTRTRGH